MNKKNLRFPAIVLFGIFALYGLVLAPLFEYLISDIVLTNTLWLDAVDLLFQYAEILGSAALLAFLIRGVYLHGVRASLPLFYVAGGALLFKYMATIAAISVLYGALDLTGGLVSYLTAFLLELALAALAVFLAHRLAFYAREQGKELQFATPPHARPVLFQFQNPLNKCVTFSILAVVLWRLAAHIISEFAYGVALRADDIPVMLLYWLILVFVPGFLGYLLACYLVKLPERY